MGFSFLFLSSRLKPLKLNRALVLTTGVQQALHRAGSHWGFSWAMGQLRETFMWWRSWCCHWREAGLLQSSGRCITGDEGLEVVGGHLLELLRTYCENRWGRPWPLVSSYGARWVLQNYWGTSEIWGMADHLFFCLPGQGGNKEV